MLWKSEGLEAGLLGPLPHTLAHRFPGTIQEVVRYPLGSLFLLVPPEGGGKDLASRQSTGCWGSLAPSTCSYLQALAQVPRDPHCSKVYGSNQCQRMLVFSAGLKVKIGSKQETLLLIAAACVTSQIPLHSWAPSPW